MLSDYKSLLLGILTLELNTYSQAFVKKSKINYYKPTDYTFSEYIMINIMPFRVVVVVLLILQIISSILLPLYMFVYKIRVSIVWDVW